MSRLIWTTMIWIFGQDTSDDLNTPETATHENEHRTYTRTLSTHIHKNTGFVFKPSCIVDPPISFTYSAQLCYRIEASSAQGSGAKSRAVRTRHVILVQSLRNTPRYDLFLIRLRLRAADDAGELLVWVMVLVFHITVNIC